MCDKLNITNMNGVTNDDDTTCGLDNMNCVTEDVLWVYLMSYPCFADLLSFFTEWTLWETRLKRVREES